MLRFLIAAVFTATCLNPVEASSTMRQEADISKSPWSAIGQVNNGAYGRCTGVLVSRQVALTAAHCLINHRTGRFVLPQSVHFVLGFNRGQYLFNTTVVKVVTAPNYEVDAPSSNVSLDWALLLLEEPAPDDVHPLIRVPRKDLGSNFVVAGYSQDRSQVLTHSAPCQITETESPALIVSSCDAPSGYSGGPLLDPASGQMAGLHVASALDANAPMSIAVAPEAWSAALRTILADDAPRASTAVQKGPANRYDFLKTPSQ